MFQEVLEKVQGRCAVPDNQLFALFFLAGRTKTLPGCAIELGVFRGGSAKMIASILDDRPVHLFDTFEGMPAIKCEHDLEEYHKEGSFCGSLEEVQEFLKDNENVIYHKGLFPDDVLDDIPEEICFAHVDVDLYKPTLSFLELIYPRMVHKGILVIHDYEYPCCPGVTKACDEFFMDKPEMIRMEVAGQCYTIKEKS